MLWTNHDNMVLFSFSLTATHSPIQIQTNIMRRIQSAAALQDQEIFHKCVTEQDGIPLHMLLTRDGGRQAEKILDYVPILAPFPIHMRAPLRFRRTKQDVDILVCVTVYNEPGEELARTLRGIARQLIAKPRSTPWVDWQRVGVFIVIDGIEKMSPSMQEYCTSILSLLDMDMMEEARQMSQSDAPPTEDHPVYSSPDQPGKDRFADIRERAERGAPVCHMFERTISLPHEDGSGTLYPPVQTTLCLKSRNGGKLNSHMWFYYGMCRQANPEFTFLLDVGTEPQAGTFRAMFHAMIANPNLGGVWRNYSP